MPNRRVQMPRAPACSSQMMPGMLHDSIAVVHPAGQDVLAKVYCSPSNMHVLPYSLCLGTGTIGTEAGTMAACCTQTFCNVLL